MSSLKNASKSRQKTYKERTQPAAREKYGFLEKKKDYKKRALDFQKKQSTLKALRRKALNKNPDEFYFKMVNTRMKDGVHQSEDPTPQYNEDQLKLMTTQDLKYVNYKRSVEQKKIEKMKGTLHMLDADDKPKNSHIIFVDSKKKAAEFDAAEYFDTHPSLVNRTYNRPRREMLQSAAGAEALDAVAMEKISRKRLRTYEELGKRIEREKELGIIAQKMEVRKQLMDKKVKKKKMEDETLTSAAQYKWLPQRKR